MFIPSIAPPAPKLKLVSGKVQVTGTYPGEDQSGFRFFVYTSESLALYHFYADSMYFDTHDPSLVFDPSAPRGWFAKLGTGTYNFCFGALGGPDPMSDPRFPRQPVYGAVSPFATITVP
jgi:hypothetical protein